MRKAKIGVILAGSGYLDGAEIQETTLALYFLDQLGVDVQCFSINQNQHHVIDHISCEPVNETRNVLAESARIVRGQISSIESADINELDGLIFPGGFGAAKNFSDFAFKGDQLTVHPTISELILGCHKQEKPLGFICITPVIAAKVISGVTVTIGNDESTAVAIQSLGANHVNCSVSEIAIDELNHVISTPAYMYSDAAISDVGKGIEQLISAVVQRVKVPA